MTNERFRSFYLDAWSGVAAGTQMYSSTSVYGGGVSTDSSGRVSGGGVSSTVNHHTRFFMRAENGYEREVSVVDGFAVRDGHQLTLASASRKPKTGYYDIYCYNHTTSSQHSFESVVNYLTRLDCGSDKFLGFVATLAAGWLFFELADPRYHWWCLAAGPIAGTIFYHLFLAGPKKALGKAMLKKASRLVP